MLERDVAKIATLMVTGAILVNIGSHGSAFAAIANIIRQTFLGGLSVVAGGTPNVR